MIHRLFSNKYNYYSGRGLIDYFNTDIISPTIPGNFESSWKSRISNRSFTCKPGDDIFTQRLACELDSVDIKALSFRKGLYSSDLIWWKLFPNTSPSRIPIALGDYLNTSEFTIQMTCTYEEFNNWGAIMGICQAWNPVGLSLGQYDNGYVGWGFYPVTITNAENKHIRVLVHENEMPSGKFNWCFVYKENRIDLIINNISIGFAIMPNNWSWTTNPGDGTLGLSLGHNYLGGNRHFKGSIYSLLIYNKALTGDEIYNNYMFDKNKYLI